MGLRSLIQRAEPKSAAQAEYKVAFYKGAAFGTLWTGILVGATWLVHSAWGGLLPFGILTLALVPLLSGVFHRAVMVPISRNVLGRRVQQRRQRRRKGRSRSRSGRRLARHWRKAFVDGVRDTLRPKR